MPLIKKIVVSFAVLWLGTLVLIGVAITDVTAHPFFEVHVLAIGQGDAILIRTTQHHTILIDGGFDNQVVYKLGEVLPFYQRSIDLVILSHPDADHLTGLIEVLRRYRVKAVLFTDTEQSSVRYRLFKAELARQGITILVAGEVTAIDLPPSGQLSVLYPRQSLAGVSLKLTNEGSIVAAVRYGQITFLFTGDTTKKIENQLLAESVDVRADILKVAHHGSDTSSDSAFLQAVAPALAVISVGVDNQFGHPHPVVVDRFHQLAIPLATTAERGDITLYTDGQLVWSVAER